MVTASVTAVTPAVFPPDVGYIGYIGNVAGQTWYAPVTSPDTAVTPPVAAWPSSGWLEQPGVTAVTLTVTGRRPL